MRLITTALPWYLAIQVCTIAALPLSARFFRNLPDKGYAFAKILGPFLVGAVLWFGTSYSMLRNELGGAWIALGIVALLSYGFGGLRIAVDMWQEAKEAAPKGLPTRFWYILAVETLFVAAFGVWIWVRAHDPAANHTEQPMDLMFMNSVWSSPTYPPRDAWLAGYAISYYYFGYWLLTTLGHLASTPPSVAYNVGQASWFGLLLVTSFGLGINLLPVGIMRQKSEGYGPAFVAGGLTAMFAGATGNLQIVLEWLYAMGADLRRVAAWVDVNGFPVNAQHSGKWYVGFDWWWWRSSRVLSDQDLLGNHIEVIDEFPMFSYVLGDNHPHVLAMPVVVLVIGMALSIYLGARRVAPRGLSLTAGGALGRVAHGWNRLLAAVPMGPAGVALVTVVSGGLVFLNTWDYPPYLLLLTAALFAGLASSAAEPSRFDAALPAMMFGAILAGGTLLFYIPYFLSAQSQVGGFTPNLFNPSRLQQVLLMFGAFLPAVVGLILWAWTTCWPTAATLGWSVAAVVGVPAALLGFSVAVATGTGRGRDMLADVALPAGATSHLPLIVERWLTRPYTFLFFGLALALCMAILWASLFGKRAARLPGGSLFVLLIAAIGLLLVYVPEFVFLKDNFGTRMNTVFKFYYQAWLLLAVAAAHVVAGSLFTRGVVVPNVVRVLSVATLVAALAALLYPVAGVYSKTAGFASTAPTLDATAYVASENGAEHEAVAWVLANTEPNDIVLEGKGASYRANYNRISSMTGRATLLGWDGHESQWRGQVYGEMASGRPEVLTQVYRTARADEIPALLDAWNIEYVYVGPTERIQYEISPRAEERLAEAMELVFDRDDVRIYRRR